MMTLNFGFPSWSREHEAETHGTFASPVAACSGDRLPDLLAAVRSGNVYVSWAPLPNTGLETTADALRVDGLRVPVTVDTARRVAALLTERDAEGGAVELLTPRIVNLFAEHARWLPPPRLLVPRHADLSDPDLARRLSDDLDRFLMCTGKGPGELVGPIADDWVLTDSSRVGREQDGGLALLRLVRIRPCSRDLEWLGLDGDRSQRTVRRYRSSCPSLLPRR